MEPEFLETTIASFGRVEGLLSFPEFFHQILGKKPNMNNVEEVRMYRKLFKCWDHTDDGVILGSDFLLALRDAKGGKGLHGLCHPDFLLSHSTHFVHPDTLS